MDVVRDLLDKAIRDRDGRPMGRVDGIVIEPRADAPPRLLEILVGPAALASRLHPRLGAWWQRLEARIGLPAARPVAIPFADIDHIGASISVRVSAGATGADAVEALLRRWVRRLPGSR